MSIRIPIISEFDGRAIEKAAREFKKLETTSQKAGFVLQKAFIPATAALAGFGAFMVKAAKGAEEARQANQRLANVLDQMGFKQATDRVAAYAESLEKTIAVDADVIKATQTKLATFGELTKSVNVAGGAFDRATIAALDLAAAGFGTAESNAIQLGKALQDPIKGLTALTKSGVTFTEAEQQKIKALVESGNLLEAQNMILGAIEKQVGGTAEASASAFDKMRFAISGVADTFGEMMLPVVDDFALKLTALSKFIQENDGAVRKLAIAISVLSGAIVVINLGMKTYTTLTNLATLANKAFTASQVAAMGKIGLMVAAIYGVVQMLQRLQQNTDSVSRGIVVAFDVVGVTLINTATLIARGIAQILNPVIDAMNAINPFEDIPRIPEPGYVSMPNRTFGRQPGFIGPMPGELGPVLGPPAPIPGASVIIPPPGGGGGGGGGGRIGVPLPAPVVSSPAIATILPDYFMADPNAAADRGITVNVTGGLATGPEIGEAVVNAIRSFNTVHGPANIAVG